MGLALNADAGSVKVGCRASKNANIAKNFAVKLLNVRKYS